MKKTALMLAGALASMTITGTAAHADPLTYPTPGVENPQTYSFVASQTGDVSAYFFGSTAAFDESLGLLIDGKDSGVTGLDNHATTNGTKLDFGQISAGSALTFYINVNDFFVGDKPTYYSDPTLNPGGYNQVYSTSYAGGDFGIPAGVYVGFEDLSNANGLERTDYNYNDERFVFTNVSNAPAVSAAPEPSSWALMLTGVAMIGAMLRAGRRRTALATA